MAKLITGKVTSDKADKTIVITVTTRRTHPLYKKQYSRNAKYMAHDEKNEAKAGDMVVIREVRPLSARKRFTLDRIVDSSGEVFKESDAEAGVEDLTKPPEAEKKAESPPEKPATKKEAKK